MLLCALLSVLLVLPLLFVVRGVVVVVVGFFGVLPFASVLRVAVGVACRGWRCCLLLLASLFVLSLLLCVGVAVAVVHCCLCVCACVLVSVVVIGVVFGVVC